MDIVGPQVMTPETSRDSRHDRAVLAVIAHVQAPYRLHVHRRIIREMPEVEVHTGYLREENDQPWKHELDPAEHPVIFGRGEGVLKFQMFRDGPADWRKGGRVIEWLRSINARAVVMGGYADFARLRAILWCRRQGIPCFLTGDSNIHSDVLTGWRRPLKNAAVRFVTRRVSLIMPFGRLGVEYYKRYGVNPDRMVFFPYEPDYSIVQEMPADRISAVRERYGLPESRRRMVICGRLAPVKRVDLAIDAFACIARERPEWDLVILGGGPLEASLKQRVPELVRQRVLWTGFVGDAREIAAIYRACHVQVHPADWEPWGLVLNEAAAARLAIVASNVTGAAGDLVEDGVNGWIFPHGDLDRLTQRLREATDPARLESLREGSLRVLADYRSRADPVAGLRNALRRSGVIS